MAMLSIQECGFMKIFRDWRDEAAATLGMWGILVIGIPELWKIMLIQKTVIDGAGLEEDGIRSYWIPKADESYYRELMKIW